MRRMPPAWSTLRWTSTWHNRSRSIAVAVDHTRWVPSGLLMRSRELDRAPLRNRKIPKQTPNA
eukprot:1182448-Prorocentrum_minimum.AAC.19